MTKFLTWQPYKSLEDAEKTLAVWVRDYERKDCYQWAIVLKGEEGCAGEPIGSISAVKYDDSISMVQVATAWESSGGTRDHDRGPQLRDGLFL